MDLELTEVMLGVLLNEALYGKTGEVVLKLLLYLILYLLLQRSRYFLECWSLVDGLVIDRDELKTFLFETVRVVSLCNQQQRNNILSPDTLY